MGPIIRPAVLTRNGLPPAPNSPQGILLVHDPSRQPAEDGPRERGEGHPEAAGTCLRPVPLCPGAHLSAEVPGCATLRSSDTHSPCVHGWSREPGVGAGGRPAGNPCLLFC